MILYVLILLILIVFFLSYNSSYEYFSNNEKQELNKNMKKTIKSMNNMISGLSHNSNSFRTCYPTGSADVD